MFTVWQLLADFRAGKTISLVKSHATVCFASYSAWQTRITRNPSDITLLWCRIQSFSEIENNKFVYGLQNSFVFVVALILDYIPLPENFSRFFSLWFSPQKIAPLTKRVYEIEWMYLRWDVGQCAAACGRTSSPSQLSVSSSGQLQVWQRSG